MSDAVPNVVFLIHPDTESCSEARREKWRKEAFSAVVKLLLDLEERLVPRTKYSTSKMPDLSHLNKLQWGYKFAKKSGIKYHGISDFKTVNAENLESFEKELKLELEDGEPVDFTAHTLFDNLTALVHDFKWEQHGMVSPVKAVRKRRSRDTDRSRLKRKFASTNDFDNDEKKNFMFVIGPLPTSSIGIEEYFQYPVRTPEEVNDVLMPNHLEMHFRKKLGIRFYWIDSRSFFKDADFLNKEGLALMNEFLQSKQGTVIPINIFLDSARNSKCLYTNSCACKRVNAAVQDPISNTNLMASSDGEQKTNSCNCHKFNSLCHVLPLSVILSPYFSNFKNSVSENSWICSLTYSDKRQSEKTSIEFMCMDMSPSAQDKNTQNQVTLKLGQQTFTTKISQKQQPTNTNVKLSAVGFTPKGDYPWECFDSSSFCVHCGVQDGFKNLMECMIRDDKNILVKELCCNCEIKSCHLLDHRLGIMQALNTSCGSLIWISRTQSNLATQITQNLDPNMLNDPNEDLMQLISVLMKDYNFKDEINKFKPAKMQGEPPVRFQPYMLESWYDTATTSRQFLELSTKLKEIKPPKKTPQQIEFENLVNAEIDAYEKESNSKRNATTKISKTNQKTFETQDEMLESVMKEYTSCLENYSDQIDQMKFSSYNIVHTINKFARDQVWDNLYVRMYDLLNENLFLTTSKIRSKDASLESKCLECKFQILLHMECFVLSKTNLLVEKEDFLENEVESIVGMLRIISLTLGIEKMTGFLQANILDQYGATCGKLIYEVFSDLMLPIPEQLLEYAGEKGAEDSFFDPLSVAPNSNIPSTGPFSTLSSVGSHGSNDSISLISRQVRSRRPSHINPISSRRQIVLPEPAKQGSNKHARAKTVDSARARLFSGATSNRQLATNSRQLATSKRQVATNERRDVTKPETLVATRILTRSSTKKTDENSNTVSSQDVVRVRRDLFASPSKSARRRALSEAQLPRKKVVAQKKPMIEAKDDSRPKSRRRPSVIDTPAAKQRMTALARQRLRMRRSTERGAEGRMSNDTVVEESPMKNEEEGIGRVVAMEAKLKRSPRHSVMLTRRHSFYKDKGAGGSRTIARAQIVQQHNEAVPPTPVQSRGPLGDRGTTAAAPAFSISPKSLLFSYSSTPGHLTKGKSNAPASQQRSRRRLQLTAGEPPKDAEKITSPIKQESNVTSPAKQDPVVTSLTKREEKVTSIIQQADNTPSPTKRTETMTSPVKDKDSVTSPSAHTSLMTSLNDGDPFDDDFETALACTTPSKLNKAAEKKSPKASGIDDVIPGTDALPFTSYNEDEKRIADVAEVKKIETRPEQEERAAVFATPQKTPRRSPRLLSSSSRKRKKREIISSPSPNDGVLRHIGPLDNYVVRTPNASARTPSTPKANVTSQRKYSPNGDHIQRWPRRKRIMDSSSPLTDAKRLKSDRPLLGNRLAPEPHDFFCLDGVSPLPSKDSLLPGNAAESPDLGVYIVSTSGEDSEQRIRRFDSPAAAAAQSPGFELLFRGKTTLGSPRKHAPDLTSPAHGFFGTPDSLASRARSQATLFKARIGSPSSKRHVQMVLLPDD